jgi:hypothetical protein
VLDFSDRFGTKHKHEKYQCGHSEMDCQINWRLLLLLLLRAKWKPAVTPVVLSIWVDGEQKWRSSLE